MEIRKLPPGEIAPEDSDCIKITATPDGRFTLLTSALLQCADDEDEATSEAVISSDEYDSYEQAEQAGLTLAEENCVSLVYVETA